MNFATSSVLFDRDANLQRRSRNQNYAQYELCSQQFAEEYLGTPDSDLDFGFKGEDNFSLVIEEKSTQSQTVPSSNPVINDPHAFDLNQDDWIKPGSNFEDDFLYSSEERKWAEPSGSADEMEIESGNPTRFEEEFISNEDERKSGATLMQNMPALFLVAVKRAFQYYYTDNQRKKRDKKKYELESIEEVISSGNFSRRTLQRFDKWIKNCKPKSKTYAELIKFLAQMNNPEVERLFKEITNEIFLTESKIWLEKSGTRKKKQYLKELEAFEITFLYVLEFKRHPESR